MTNQREHSTSSTSISHGSLLTALALVMLCALTIVPLHSAQAQSFTVLHNFADRDDGARPYDTLTLGRAGNLYGTAEFGGPNNFGTVFELAHHGSDWILSPIYIFRPESDGSLPLGPITIGPDGIFYGTTSAGGFGGGSVYRLRPQATAPASVIAQWSQTTLHSFNGLDNGSGAYPGYPALIFDQAGNIYGTTESGGTGSGDCDAVSGGGVVFELTPFGGDWIETVLYNFDDGCPEAGVIADSAGNLYGTTPSGGANRSGTVYELSPTQSGWQQTVLHAFDGTDGTSPNAGLIMDQAGNFYGATSAGGSGAGGVIYQLSPSNGGWSLQVLYNLVGKGGPQESLTMDAAGNLYGTALADGAYESGMVFKLSQSSGIWTLTDLHDFSQDTTYSPYGGVTLDTNGNLYGTTIAGGAYGYGVVWEITP